MDAAVIKYYRRLLRDGFEYAGSLNNPSIFLESVGERMICRRPADYMQLFINVSGNKIDDIKYLCNCEPASNVAIEILCSSMKGKTLEEVATATEDPFLKAVGSESEEMKKKTKWLLEFLNKGLTRYKTEISQNKS